MKVVSAYSINGGVGKTAAAVNLAYISALEGARTLLWDLDPKATASGCLGHGPGAIGGSKKLVFGDSELSRSVIGTRYANLDLVPADLRDPEACPATVAAAVESAVLADHGDGSTSARKLPGARYKAKLRSLLFNLKDASNPDARRRALNGDLTAVELVRAGPEELASDARKAENDAIRAAALFEAEISAKKNLATTDQFRCGKCRQHKCTYYQMQTRSADEPMTTFVQCVNCGNRWRFC